MGGEGRWGDSRRRRVFHEGEESRPPATYPPTPLARLKTWGTRLTMNSSDSLVLEGILTNTVLTEKFVLGG